MLFRARGARLLALALLPLFALHLSTSIARAALAEEPAALESAEPLIEMDFTEFRAESEAFRPSWGGRIGAVILERGQLRSQPFVYNTVTGDPILSTTGFDFGFRGGVDVAVIRHGEFFDVDFRYFGVDQWNASQGPVFSPAGGTIAFPGLPPSPDPVIAQGTYGSELASAEINLRRNVSNRLTMLAGFRYLSFDEDFYLHADTIPTGTSDIYLNTTNKLYGMQIGADGILYDNGRRFRIESAIKAGVYGNDASFSLSFPGPLNLGLSRAHTAFVGDLNFTGVYQLTDSLAIRAGYQLLWLSGVAVVSEQPPGVDLFSGEVSVTTSGTAFFHGAMVGLESNW